MTIDEIPQWPTHVSPTLLLDVFVDHNPDEVVELLYPGSGKFQDAFNTACNNTHFKSTPWSKTGAQAAAAKSKSQKKGKAGLVAGMLRKTSFSSSSKLGGKFNTEEVWYVAEAQPGQRYVLLTKVTTTAPYGDKFTPFVRHEIESKGPKSCTLKVTLALVFQTKVNSFIKGVITKGANDGTTKNFRVWKDTMQQFVTVKPMGSEGAAEAEALEEEEAMPGFFTRFEFALGLKVRASLKPWAELIHLSISNVPVLSMIEVDIILSFLCLLVTMTTLRLLLDVLQFLEHAGSDPTNLLGYFTNYFFRVVHVPHSIREVISACCIFVMVRWVNNRLAPVLPAPPDTLHHVARSLSEAASNNVPVAEAPVAVVKRGAPISPKNPVSDSDAESVQQGVKYDGYSEAIASAAASVQVEEKALAASVEGISTIANRQSEAALQQLRKGLQNMTRGVGTIGSPTPGKSGVASPIHSPPPGVIKEEQEADVNSNEGEEQQQTPSSPPTPPAKPPAFPEEMEVAPYVAPDLPHHVSTAAVVDEVFENERTQPFRGWGHTWPGHFLPTDKTLRWSLRDISGETTITTSQKLEEVAPDLPDGWQWVDNAWRLDLSGVGAGCVDKEGWSYALDFNWVTFPFSPGSGKKGMQHFVRRRRWLRTRIPSALAPQKEEQVESTKPAEKEDELSSFVTAAEEMKLDNATAEKVALVSETLVEEVVEKKPELLPKDDDDAAAPKEDIFPFQTAKNIVLEDDGEDEEAEQVTAVDVGHLGSPQKAPTSVKQMIAALDKQQSVDSGASATKVVDDDDDMLIEVPSVSVGKHLEIEPQLSSTGTRGGEEEVGTTSALTEKLGSGAIEALAKEIDENGDMLEGMGSTTL